MYRQKQTKWLCSSSGGGCYRRTDGIVVLGCVDVGFMGLYKLYGDTNCLDDTVFWFLSKYRIDHPEN